MSRHSSVPNKHTTIGQFDVEDYNSNAARRTSHQETGGGVVVASSCSPQHRQLSTEFHPPALSLQLSLDKAVTSVPSDGPVVDDGDDDADKEKLSEDDDDDGDEPLSGVFFEPSGTRLGRRVLLNVGGTRHEVPWKTLSRLPRSRLGQLATCRTRRELTALCDDYDLTSPMPEFFFDRYPRSFSSVLDFYRTGRLHVADETGCVLAFGDDLSYWAIDELYMEACCQQRYQQRKEQVLDVLRKELENMTLGGTSDDNGESAHGEGEETGEGAVGALAGVDDAAVDDEPAVVKWRRKVWDLMEKPQSSIFARVSRYFRRVCRSSLYPCSRVARWSPNRSNQTQRQHAFI